MWLIAAFFAAVCATGTTAYAGPEQDKIPVAVAVADSAWSSTIFGTGVKTNDEYTDGHIFLTVPIWSSIGRDGKLGGGYLFIEPYASIGTGGEVAKSLGLAYRHLFSDQPFSALQKEGRAKFMEEGWFLGANFFVDQLETQHDNRFWQLGVGAEVGTRYVDLRGNYYIPVSSRELVERVETTQTFSSSSTVFQQSGAGTGEPFAAGHQILQDVNLTTTAVTTTQTTTVRTVTEIFEEGMEGWDVELGVLVPGLDEWMDVRLMAGYFKFDNQPFGPQEFGTGNVEGWKLGAEVRPVPAVVLSACWYEDERFTGANWTVGLQLQIPLDRSWKDAFRMRRRHLVERMAEPVRRQNEAVKIGNEKEEETTSNTSVQRTTRVVSQTQKQIILADDIIFVNNGGPVGNGIGAGDDVTGDGSAAKPKATIQAGADIAATNNTATGRVWNVYTQHQPSSSYFENVDVTQSTNFISSGTLIMGEGGKTFGTGIKPVMGGSFTALGIGFLGVTAYEINSSSEGGAIFAQDVSSLRVASNVIRNTGGPGVNVAMFSGNTGSAQITGNVFVNTTSGSDGLTFLVDGFDSYLYAQVTNNLVTGSGASGVSMTVANEAFADLTMIGNTMALNSANGLSINLSNLGDLSAFFANNRFDNNANHGASIVLDFESVMDFESVGDTFVGNLGDGLHIESHDVSDLLPSVVTNATFMVNGVNPLYAETTLDGAIALTLVNTIIFSDNGFGVHGVVGDGSGGGFVNLSLFFVNSTVNVAGTGSATGILIESPLTGVAALGLFNSNVFVDGPASIGVSLMGTGVSCGCTPSIGAQIYDSLITGTNAVVGVDIVASNASAVALDLQGGLVSALQTGINVSASGTGMAGVGISEGSSVVSGLTGVNVTASDTAYVSLGIFDSFLAGDVLGGGLNLDEQTGATIEAFVSGNAINALGGASIRFSKAGESTAAIFENNSFVVSAGKGLEITRSAGADFTAFIEGNNFFTFGDGITLINNAAGLIEAHIQSNTLSNTVPFILPTGILLQATSGSIDVNPAPVTLENNSVSDYTRFLDSIGNVTGSIQINGVDIVLPATVP